MSISNIIQKLDEADKEIRDELSTPNNSLGKSAALQRARNSIQHALTPLLDYQNPTKEASHQW